MAIQLDLLIMVTGKISAQDFINLKGTIHEVFERNEVEFSGEVVEAPGKKFVVDPEKKLSSVLSLPSIWIFGLETSGLIMDDVQELKRDLEKATKMTVHSK